MAFGPSKRLKWRSTIILGSYPNQNGPTNFAEEPHLLTVGQGCHVRRDISRRWSIQIAQHNDRELVIGVVRQLSVEAFDPAPVIDQLVSLHRAHAEAARIVVLKRRGHLFERRRREDLSAEKSLLPPQQVFSGGIERTGGKRDAHVNEARVLGPVRTGGVSRRAVRDDG